MALTAAQNVVKKSANPLNFVQIVGSLLKKKILKFTNKNSNKDAKKMPKLIEKALNFTLFGWLFLLSLSYWQVG